MVQAFLDESGDETPFGGEPCLSIALLIIDRPRPLDLAVTRARRKYRAGLASGEMKADASPPDVTTWLLHAIAATAVEIVTVTVDKSVIVRPPSDAGDIYRTAVAEAVHHAVQRWPALELHLDKRYTTRRLRERLDTAILARIDNPEAITAIHHHDSIAVKALQAADFVAWAIFQKHARSKPEFYDIVAPKIVDEVMLQIALW